VRGPTRLLLCGATVVGFAIAASPIENDTFNGFAPANGYDIASTPNPFYFNVCTGANSPTFVPSGTAMGVSNAFSNLCYSTSNDVAGLPPSTCKS
jgi:hypothetical protein